MNYPEFPREQLPEGVRVLCAADVPHETTATAQAKEALYSTTIGLAEEHAMPDQLILQWGPDVPGFEEVDVDAMLEEPPENNIRFLGKTVEFHMARQSPQKSYNAALSAWQVSSSGDIIIVDSIAYTVAPRTRTGLGALTLDYAVRALIRPPESTADLPSLSPAVVINAGLQRLLRFTSHAEGNDPKYGVWKWWQVSTET